MELLIDPTPGDVWARLDKAKPSEHRVLVIHNITDEWCEALCARYPESVNQRFFLEHILGLDSKARRPHVALQGQDELGQNIAANLERIDGAFPCLSDDPKSGVGGHIDSWLEPQPVCPTDCLLRGCRLRRVPSGWVKTNRFMSYCQLQENFCKSNRPECQICDPQL